MAAGPPRRLSTDPIDYASFVLYLKRGVPACEELLRIASTQQDVIVQDIDHIEGPRPSWLRGVPTLVSIPSYTLHTGTQALAVMQQHVRGRIQGVSAQTIVPRGVGASLLDEDDMASDVAASFGGLSDPRYGDAASDAAEAPRRSLEDMVRQRTGATTRVGLSSFSSSVL